MCFVHINLHSKIKSFFSSYACILNAFQDLTFLLFYNSVSFVEFGIFQKFKKKENGGENTMHACVAVKANFILYANLSIIRYVHQLVT